MDAPLILREGHYSSSDVDRLHQTVPIWKTIDIYKQQWEELQEISIRLTPKPPLKLQPNSSTAGDWIYFPWSGNLVHMVNQNDYYRLRTNRNQLLISPDEQHKLAQTTVGCVGLSIGSHFVAGLAYSGIADTFKLADMDTLSASNLNRIRSNVSSVGQPKLEVITQQVYEINPYQQFEKFERGLDQATVHNFFSAGKDLSLVFEAVDDFKLKTLLRIKAKEFNVPVIMITNLGDSLLVDIERYDLNPQPKLFNGLLTQDEIREITKPGKIDAHLMKYIINLVGHQNLSTRVLNSLNHLGVDLVGRPQLYGTVAIGGGVAAYVARQIVLGAHLPSGRVRISLDQAFAISGANEVDRGQQLAQLMEKARL